MATILEFKQQAEQNRGKDICRPQSSAEIIIFPGVRYERWAEPASASEPISQQNGRDILTLVE
jgi:hypothetical protein